MPLSDATNGADRRRSHTPPGTVVGYTDPFVNAISHRRHQATPQELPVSPDRPASVVPCVSDAPTWTRARGSLRLHRSWTAHTGGAERQRGINTPRLLYPLA